MQSTEHLIRESLNEALASLQTFIGRPANIEAIEQGASLLAEAIKGGHLVLSCGNGGSLCDATHFAEELTGRFRNNRVAMPAVALNDPAHITCVGNDYSFDDIFSRAVEAIGSKGDVLVALSTSGGSANVLRAVDAAHRKGMKVIGLTADTDNALRRAADVAICAPKTRYSDRIQEIHIKALHIMVQAVEEKLIYSHEQKQ